MWADAARAKYARAAKRSATDLTDAESALIEPAPPPRHRLGRPRTTDLRAVPDAIFYLLRTGCQWAMPKSTVFGYFRRWRQDGTLLWLYDALLVLARQAAGREPQPTALDRAAVKHRQPVGQDQRQRWPAWLRRQQEDQRPDSDATRARCYTTPRDTIPHSAPRPFVDRQFDIFRCFRSRSTGGRAGRAVTGSVNDGRPLRAFARGLPVGSTNLRRITLPSA